MNVAAPLQRYGRSYGLPWQSGAVVRPSVVALSAAVPLRLDRDPVDEVAGSFKVLRAENSGSVCQVDWRVEGLTTDPVLPAHFVGGVLPSGTAFFTADLLEVAASVLLSPGADPARESYGQIVLENPVNCGIAAGSPSLALSIVAEPIAPPDAVVSLDVPFSEIDPGGVTPPPPPDAYALGPDWTVNWTLHQADDDVSTITQLPGGDGVELKAGANTNEDDGAIQLFAKRAPEGKKWVWTFKYVWLDGFTSTTGAGCFTRWGYYRGKGTGGIEANPNLWSAADAGDISDPTMSLNAATSIGGIRSSINTQNSELPERTNKCRMRHYLGPNGRGETDEMFADNDQYDFNFTQGTEYDISITLDDDKFTVRKSATGTTTQTVSFTSDFIGDMDDGWIFMEATVGRRCRIRAMALDDGTVKPPPPPPPPSAYTYDLDIANYRIIPEGNEADLWPCTWAQDGNDYTIFGDGPSGSGSVSIGLARLTGSTKATLEIDYITGGPSPRDHDKFEPITGWPEQDGGLHAKSTSVIALGNSLYLWIVKGGPNPDGWKDCRVGRIALNVATDRIELATWGMGQDWTWKTINPCFLQCGQNFGTAFDAYVYAFPQHYAPVEHPADSPSHDPAKFYLIRCLRTANWQTQSNWEWWTGGSDAAPTWGTYTNRVARITLTGSVEWRPTAFYIGGVVDQCVFRIGRTGDPDFGGGGMSRFATFIAQRPWHEFTMIEDKQYLATGLDPDLDMIHVIPHTLTVDSEGVATWLDTTWGGQNTDQCIIVRSTLTPGEPPVLTGTWTGPAGDWTGPAGDWKVT